MMRLRKQKIFSYDVDSVLADPDYMPGGENFSDAGSPTSLLVFNLEGDYLKTLNVGYRIMYFCYDKENNRILMALNDEIQFGYLSLEKII